MTVDSSILDPISPQAETAVVGDAPVTETPTSAPVLPSNNPFHLIIGTSHTQVEKIAGHYGLSHVRFLDDLERQLRLPGEGFKRGQTLDRFLGEESPATVTLAVVQDDVWVEMLRTNGPMAASVWRSLESKLFGHRTNGQRLMVIIGQVPSGMGVRQAADAGHLLVINSGQALPTGWVPQRQKKEVNKVPVKAPVKNASQYGLVGKVAPKKAAVGEKKPATPLKDKGVAKERTVKGQAPRARHAGPTNPIYGDLYLLCKGHYGPVGDAQQLEARARRVIQHHTGAGMVFQDEICKMLFDTLLAFSSRSYWGGFKLLRDLVNSVGRGPLEAAQTLSGWIAMIPVNDNEGRALPQPQPNPAFLVQ